jgi:general secretion pathway protein L
MYSTGLLIKNDQMIIVSLNQGLRETSLEGYEVLPLVEVKGEARDEAIVFNLDRFFKMHRGARDNFFIGLPRDQALAQYVYLPLAVEENLRTALSYEIDRLTPFSADAVYFDYYVVKRFPAKNLLHVMLVTIKRELIDHYVNLLKRVDIRPRSIEITSSALFNIYRIDRNGAETFWSPDWIINNPLVARLQGYVPKLFPHKLHADTARDAQHAGDTNVLIAYMNGHYELNIVTDGMLSYSRSLPLAVPDTASPLEQQMKHHLNAVQAEVQKGLLTVPGYRAHEGTVRCFVTGRELDEQAARTYSELTSMDCVLLRDVPIAIKDTIEKSRMDVLPIAIGLALKGLRRVPLDINFIPASIRPKKKRSKKKIGALIALGAIVFLLGISTINTIIQRRSHIAELDMQLSELKTQAQSIEAMQDEIDRVEKYNAIIKQVREQDVSKLKILEELTGIIPDDSWLTDFEYSAENKKITLTGYSTSASQLIQLLEESKLFVNVKFTSPITKGTNVKENFKIEMTLEQGKAPAAKTEPPKK